MRGDNVPDPITPEILEKGYELPVVTIIPELYLDSSNDDEEFKPATKVIKKNFKKISDDCKIFLEEFRDCLDNIPDPAWEEKEIQKCVGKDFTRVVNNICKWKFEITFRLRKG